VPDAEMMGSVLDAIDTSLDEVGPAYVHCWGGHGRTGTAIGCWLVRHQGTCRPIVVSLLKYSRVTQNQEDVHPRRAERLFRSHNSA
jgi:protein-tyrosine phosphatase